VVYCAKGQGKEAFIALIAEEQFATDTRLTPPTSPTSTHKKGRHNKCGQPSHEQAEAPELVPLASLSLPSPRPRHHGLPRFLMPHPWQPQP